MGEHNVEQELDERKLHEFTQALLADLRALAFMLEQISEPMCCSPEFSRRSECPT